MSTHITEHHISAFKALTSGQYANFALFSCHVNGQPAAAIVAVTRDAEEFTITPLFVSVTDDMILSDHEGNLAGGAS